MAKKKTYTSRSPTRRAKGAVFGLGFHLIGAAAFGAASAWHLALLLKLDQGMAAGPDFVASESTGFILAFGLSSLIYLASVVVSLVLFLMWIHRTNRNAHVLAPSFEMSPAWGVGWFFVPFAGLVKPFEGVEKTWCISTDPTRWRSQDTPALLRWWWGLFLASNIAGSFSNLVSRENTVAGQSAAAGLTIATMAVVVASCVASIILVRRLTSRQVVALNTLAFD